MNPISRLSLRLPLRRTAATLSLVVAAGLASTAVLASPHGSGMGHMGAMGAMGGMGGPGMMMGGRGMDRMLDAVNATAEQRAQIRQIHEAARADMRAQHETQRGLREQMRQLFTQPTVDANAVEALRQQMMAGHDRRSQRMTQAMVEASRVLTPEQRRQIGERMQRRGEMMRRHHEERRSLDRPTS